MKWLCMTVALLAFPAWSEEPKVELTAEVVLASNQGNALDPPELVKTKEMFAKAGINMSSFRRLSSQKLALAQGIAAELALPNGRKASLILQDIKKGSAHVQVKIADLVSTVLKLGQQGSLFQHAGAFDGGQLFLVLSPAEKR
jgi:hypothetical protein